VRRASRPTARQFAASLSVRAKLITYGVCLGVGFGVPAVLGASFAIGFDEPLLLLFSAALRRSSAVRLALPGDRLPG